MKIVNYTSLTPFTADEAAGVAAESRVLGAAAERLDCVRSSLDFDARLSKIPYDLSKISVPSHLGEAETLLASKFQSATLAEIEAALTERGPLARALVVGEREIGIRPDHMFNAFVDKAGKVRFYDRQIRRAANTADEFIGFKFHITSD